MEMDETLHEHAGKFSDYLKARPEIVGSAITVIQEDPVVERCVRVAHDISTESMREFVDESLGSAIYEQLLADAEHGKTLRNMNNHGYYYFADDKTAPGEVESEVNEDMCRQAIDDLRRQNWISVIGMGNSDGPSSRLLRGDKEVEELFEPIFLDMEQDDGLREMMESAVTEDGHDEVVKYAMNFVNERMNDLYREAKVDADAVRAFHDYDTGDNDITDMWEASGLCSRAAADKLLETARAL